MQTVRQSRITVVLARRRNSIVRDRPDEAVHGESTFCHDRLSIRDLQCGSDIPIAKLSVSSNLVSSIAHSFSAEFTMSYVLGATDVLTHNDYPMKCLAEVWFGNNI